MVIVQDRLEIPGPEAVLCRLLSILVAVREINDHQRFVTRDVELETRNEPGPERVVKRRISGDAACDEPHIGVAVRRAGEKRRKPPDPAVA